MDNLDGQTAPESTRGLFDAPDSPARRSDWVDKRRSVELGPRKSMNKLQHRNSALHTVNEEVYQKGFVDTSPLFQRKQRSSVAHFNNFPLAKRPDDADEAFDNRLSRADVLAETEAKLNGHNKSMHRFSGQAFGSGGSRNFESHDDKQNRRLSEPNARLYNNYNNASQPLSDYNQDRLVPNNNSSNKRMSFQYNSSRQYEDTTPNARRLSLTKSNLMDMDKRNRNDNDWRSKSPTGTPGSRPSSMIFNNHRLSTGSSIMDNSNSGGGGGYQRKPLFTSHLPFSSVVPYLKSNMLVSGLLRVNKRNRSDAYVFCEDLNADIYICGSRDRNRALEGDHVAIKLIEVDQVMLEKHEKEEAKLARNNGNPVVRKPDEEDEKEIIFGGEEDVDLVPPKFCGVVVAILDRAQKQVFSGTLGLTRPSNKRGRSGTIGAGGGMGGGNGGRDDQQQRDSSVPRIIWFKPTDKRVPLIAIPVEQAPPGFVENNEAFENKLFLGSIKRWPITSLHPFGVLENELGLVEDTRVQLRAILADNNFTSQVYTDTMVRSIPFLTADMIERDIRSNVRRDMRSVRSIAFVDKEGGFVENALSVVPLSDSGTFEIGLHVADITAFVPIDSVIDKEARSRGVDVYHTIFEDVPLWPKVLRQECTDLVQGRDRFAFSVVWTMDHTGKVMDTWYGKTVINSQEVLSLQEMQEMIECHQDEPSKDTTTSSDISTLYGIARFLRQGRSEKALFIEPAQLDIRFQDNHYPSFISAKAILPAECILTEFQVLANTQIAQKISSHFPDHALLQSQSGPNERRLHDLARYLQSLGYHIKPSSPSSLQQSIDAIENPDAKAVIATLVMKCMSPQKYFCTGAFDINRYHHYSHNTPLYTHFCSPTKRYADTMVHRQLEAALKKEQFFFMEPEMVQKTAQHCNVKARAAASASEQTQHMFSSYYLANNSGTSTNRIHEAIVVGVQEGAFDVIVPELGLERRIHTINLPLKSNTYSPSENVLHLIWIQGEPTVDAIVESASDRDGYRSNSLSSNSSSIEDTFSVREHDEKDDGVLIDLVSPDEQVKRLSIKSSSTTALDELARKKNHRRSISIRAVQGEDAWITQKECTFPEECRQLIRPFDFVKVVITADPIRSPPLIRVLAANPFVTKQQ